MKAMVLASVLALLLLGGPAFAVSSPDEVLRDPAQEQRARDIGHQLRCMVCQNQSIEESEADLARDLRRIVREQVVAGRDDAQVLDYLHDRYGDFVLLRPRFTAGTLLLWGSPLLALGFGLALVLALRRRAAAPAPAPLTEAEQQRLTALEANPER